MRTSSDQAPPEAIRNTISSSNSATYTTILASSVLSTIISKTQAEIAGAAAADIEQGRPLPSCQCVSWYLLRIVTAAPAALHAL
jgi:hypothetical protein